MMKWCGYIDMLGTREAVRRSKLELGLKLNEFHGALSDGFGSFVHGRCFAFSDGAFFVSEEVNNFHEFYVRVRNQLFQQGVFFRCSLIQGDIDVVKDMKGRVRADGVPDFFSLTFAGDAPKAYQWESQFKGVGCTIEWKNEENKRVIPSFFLKMSGSAVKSYVHYDFRFSSFELSAPDDLNLTPSFEGERRVFDQLISACHATLTQSSEIGSYYVSALASMVRSLDLSSVEYSIEEGWRGAPYVFREFMTDGMTKVLKGLPGIHLIYLAIFDHLFSQHNRGLSPEMESAILRRLLRVPGCFKNLDLIPEGVIRAEARHQLISIKVADARARHKVSHRNAHVDR